MKTATNKLKNMLKDDHAIRAKPKVMVEWNMNRYHDTRAYNEPDDQMAGYNVDIFPIDSIIEPLRPRKGVNKARVSQGVVTAGYTETGRKRAPRFYVADESDQYKYWTSPKPAVGGVVPVFNSTNFPDSEYPGITGYDGQTSARPAVEYGNWSGDTFTISAVPANKVVVKFENSWATPDDFDIVISMGNETVTIPSTSINNNWAASGEIVLRWNGTSWTDSNTITTDANDLPVYRNIRRIQAVVRTLKAGYHYTDDGELIRTTYVTANGEERNTNGDEAFVDVIEISARLEADLSPWVISMSDQFELSDASAILPVGTLTSNVASVTLDNTYVSNGEVKVGAFNRENNEMVWSRYIEANAQMSGSYLFYDEDDVFVEEIPQFTMYTDMWKGQASESVEVDLADFSKFFNGITPTPSLWTESTVAAIIARVLDSIGFSDYNVERGDLTKQHYIEVFHMTDDQNVWEILDELARASQTAIYFDGNGILQVLTREYAFKNSTDAVYNLRETKNSEQLPNIISLEQNEEFEPNHWKIGYTKTDWTAFNSGRPTMKKVWEPEGDTVVLRGTQLVRDLPASGDTLWIGSDEVKSWPFEGMVNIEGELMRYEGKHYVYYTGATGSTREGAYVTSQEDVDKIQKTKVNSKYTYKSHFTGALKVVERGMRNSTAKDHFVEATGYSTRHYVRNIRRYKNIFGVIHRKWDSEIEMEPPKGFRDYRDLLFHTRGQTTDFAPIQYGTRIKFVKQSNKTTQTAGIVFFNDGLKEDGYFVELQPSRLLTGARRKHRDELIVYSRINGKDTRIASGRVAIGENIEYEMDVFFEPGAHRIQVWINGRNIITVHPPGSKQRTPTGRFGLFARGKTRVRFEYLYALRGEPPVPEDDFTFLDRVRRGYFGGQWDREWAFSWKTYRKVVKGKQEVTRRRLNQYMFDDFGPYVHEVREFEVKFDPAPVLHSRLYITNDWSTEILEYNATPYGAKFLVANTQRQNAVIHGEDKLSFAGTGAAVNQVMTVFGRTLVEAESETVTRENKNQIRIRGKSESELSSRFIQSKKMAKDLAKWLGTHWTYGNENLDVEIFGNPLIEVGDVVNVNYPSKHVTGDFFVLGVDNSFDNGIATRLTLRRRV